MRPQVLSGACRAQWQEREWPTGSCRSIKSRRRSFVWQLSGEESSMPKQASVEIREENYKFLQRHVYSQAGIVLEEDKHYLFETRLAPIVQELGLGSINDLCALLKATREEKISRSVAEAMTTNETYFFRNPSHFEAIRKELLPRLRAERKDTKRLRFWSAASSTGQEAYTLAMVLLEEGLGDWDIQILGADYSSRVVERARAGKYHQIEVDRGLPAPLLIKYFERSGVDWQ